MITFKDASWCRGLIAVSFTTLMVFVAGNAIAQSDRVPFGAPRLQADGRVMFVNPLRGTPSVGWMRRPSDTKRDELFKKYVRGPMQVTLFCDLKSDNQLRKCSIKEASPNHPAVRKAALKIIESYKFSAEYVKNVTHGFVIVYADDGTYSPYGSLNGCVVCGVATPLPPPPPPKYYGLR